MAFSAAPPGGQRISITGPPVIHRLSASGAPGMPTYAYPGTAPAGQALTVVPASMHDGTMNTASAEHQKTKITVSGEAVEFSSPFQFSQGEGEQAAPQRAPQVSAPRVSLTTQQIYQELPPIVNQMANQMIAPAQSMSHSMHPSGTDFGIGHASMYQQQSQCPVVVQHVIIAQQQPPPQPQIIYQQVPVQSQPPPMQPPPQSFGPILEGWLAKRGEDFGQPWLERWFTLHQNGSLVYSKQQGGKADKEINLASHVRVRPMTHPEATGQGKVQAAKKPFGLEIYPGTTGRTYYIDAGSMEKRDIWCRALNEAIMQKQGLPGGPCPYGGMNYGYR